MAAWAPEVFVQQVLVEWLRVSEVWVGANFLFGHDRAGNFSLLRLLGARFGFRAEKIDPVRYKDFVVSSTRVRRLIARGAGGRGGDAARAPLLHGRHGRARPAARAACSGFPTANLDTENELIPPNGVYATLVTLDGIVYPSVTNIGVRPTFHQPSATVIETHLLDVDRDLYDLQLAAVVPPADPRRADLRRHRGAEGPDRGRLRPRARAVRADLAVDWISSTAWTR